MGYLNNYTSLRSKGMYSALVESIASTLRKMVHVPTFSLTRPHLHIHASTRIVPMYTRQKTFPTKCKKMYGSLCQKHSNRVWAWQYAIKAGMMAYKTRSYTYHSPIPTSWGYVCLTSCFFNATIPAFIAYCHAQTLFECFLA